MKKILSILFIAAMALFACREKKQIPQLDIAEQKTTEVAADPAKDSTEIRTVIIDFYNWYNKNIAKFQKYNLYSSIKKKDAPPYKINWDEVEKYQAFIRNSVPQLGEEFINNQKRFFQQCDSAFKADVKDDIPYGFDYDWYTNSQDDPQYLVDQISGPQPWGIAVTDDKAIADVKGFNDYNGKQAIATIITIIMKKENGKWKIAKIGND